MGFLLKDKDIKAFLQGFALLLIVMLLLSGVVTVIQFARADGASTTEEVWVQWKMTWAGRGTSTDGKKSLEEDCVATYNEDAFNFSDLDVDLINVTAMRTYIYWSETNDAFTRDWYFSAWEHVTQINADARVHNDTWELQNYDGTGHTWVTRTFSQPWNFTADPFYFGVASSGGAGNVYLEYETSGDVNSSLLYDYAADAPDPFAESVTYTGREGDIQLTYLGYKNTTTTHNLYYGNASHYVVRRDLNYTFPTGSGSRQIRITYPVAESLVNITRSNGGAWDQILSSSDYSISTLNGTHDLITISDATIALYGGDYRVFTQSFPYLYTLYGLYYENGTSAGDTDVTVYFTNGTTTTVNVSGTYTLSASNEIDEISWEAEQDARPIAFYQNSGTYYLFTPEDTYGVYQFDINDYSGRVGQGECYLESYRAVNGTWRLIERRQFTGIYNDVPMLMVLYEIYKVQIRFSDGSIYDHGYFYPGVDLAPTIAVTEIEFGDQAHTVYQYITAEATRPNATHIQLDYTDETPGYDTTAANMTVSYRNGTQAYSSVVAGADTITFNWYGANNITDYVVRLYITHQLHGSIQQTWILDYSRIFESFPNFELFGDMGGLPTTNLLAIAVGLVVAGACSFKSAALAPFLFMCIQAIFTYLGGASYTDTQLGIGIALSIMLGLAIGDRQI